MGGPDDRAWGLMPASLYRAAVERTLVRDWEPKFGRLGFDARAAWLRDACEIS
jgi:hypothetical protein